MGWFAIVALMVFLPAIVAWIRGKLGVFDDLPSKAMLSVICGICGFIVVPPVGHVLAAMTTGARPDYSVGERTGVITKLSEKGMLWKTWEGEMQMGTGDLAALQTPFSFSVSDPEVLGSVKGAVGKKVTLKYTQWFVQPFRRGESGYEVTSIDVR